MTPEEFAKLQRAFLIRSEKNSAVLIDAEFASLKREINEYLLKNLSSMPSQNRIRQSAFLEEFLDNLTRKIDALANPFGQIVACSQSNVIGFAGDRLKRYLKLKIETSIFSPDRQAIRNLIGRAFPSKALQKVFKRMTKPVADRARVELIEGFALGESNAAIAKRVEGVTEMARYRALVISRNETIMAYRNASMEFYDEAGIIEYRFLSALDPRTCLVCWRLHGTRWKLKEKPHIHTQCRCAMLPVLKSDGKIKTGIELFDRLETGMQRQILGNKRYEMYQQGNRLESLVGVKGLRILDERFLLKI